MSGTLYTISAPSGAGKTSLIKALIEQVPDIIMSISYTTRAQRPGEIEGVDYHFIDEANFEQLITEGALLEYANVFKCHYGTGRDWVSEKIAADLDVILEIDWQGAAQIKQLWPDVVSVFILPPSVDTLFQRLSDRKQDSQETIDYRLSVSKEEMSHYQEYDYLLINDDFDSTLGQLKSIVGAHRASTAVQKKKYAKLITELLD